MINPAQTHKQDSNKYFLIAFGLLNILAFTLLLCTLSFLLGSGIAKWQFPLACILALVTNYYASKFFMKEKAKGSFFKTSGTIIVSVIALILLAGLFYDVSWDGQWYHQETVYRLKQGYNPARQTLAVPADELWDSYYPEEHRGINKIGTPPVSLKYLNINHFGKSTEIIEAAIYQVTNRIETSKAVNGILLLACLFLSVSLLYKLDIIKSNKIKWLLAILLAFNPITITQLFTFCVDGNVACLLLCLLVIGCLLFMETNRYYLLLLFSILTVIINIKFTALVFAGMYCAGFLIVLLIYKKIDAFKAVLVTGIISVIIGVFCCGFNPYVTNVANDHDVFYGLKETQIEILRVSPAFRNFDRFGKLFFSLAAHEGQESIVKPVWKSIKIPLTFNKKDIIAAKESQEEISGFGPFFSGALLAAIVLFVIISLRIRKTQPYKYSIAVILIIFSTIAIIPDSWWARFVPQLWLLPIIVVFMLEFISIRGQQIYKYLLYLIIGLNIIWASLSIFTNVLSAALINYQMQQLKAYKGQINVKYASIESFKSNRVRFIEWGIPVNEKDTTGANTYTMPSSNTKIKTAVTLPDLPKSFLVKTGYKFKGN
jgi:hypothetical protein